MTNAPTILALSSLMLVSACTVVDPSLGYESQANETVDTPSTSTVGTPDWNDDARARGGRGSIPGWTSDGYWDDFYICQILHEEAASCGQTTTISDGETVSINGSVSIPLGEGLPTIGVSVSHSTTTRRSYPISSGPCETCWAEVCFVAKVRRWTRPGFNMMMFVPGSTSAGYSMRREWVPAATKYETELSSPRITSGRCEPDPLCEQINPEECGPDAGAGETSSEGGDAAREEQLSDPASELPSTIPAPRSMSRETSQTGGWDGLSAGAQCEMILDREATAEAIGETLGGFFVSTAGGAVRSLSPTDLQGCPNLSEYDRLVNGETDAGVDAGRDTDAGVADGGVGDAGNGADAGVDGGVDAG